MTLFASPKAATARDACEAAHPHHCLRTVSFPCVDALGTYALRYALRRKRACGVLGYGAVMYMPIEAKRSPRPLTPVFVDQFSKLDSA